MKSELSMSVFSDELLDQVELNQCSMFNLFSRSPGVEIHQPEGDQNFFSILTEAPLPIFNNILRVRVSSSVIEEVVDSYTKSCKINNVPALWWSSPLTSPSNLESVLIDHGWRSMDEIPAAMTAELKQIRADDSFEIQSNKLLIKCVEDQNCKYQFSKLLTQVFELPSSAIEIVETMLFHPTCIEDHSFQHYLGFVDGNPVAAGSLFVKDDAAGIYNVCVSPVARKRRFGEMVTRHLLDVANQLGCSRSVLQSSPMAMRLYEKIGFQQCGSFRLFLLNI